MQIHPFCLHLTVFTTKPKINEMNAIVQKNHVRCGDITMDDIMIMKSCDALPYLLTEYVFVLFLPMNSGYLSRVSLQDIPW